MSSNSFKIKNSAVLTPKDLTELVNPESGELACDINDNNKIKRYDANIPGWVEVGSGAGGINYIDNPDFEGNTNGWFTYADAAGVAPVDGTGGTSALTISRSTSSPLRGTASLNIAKPASNAQGSGVSVDFSIDPADQTKLVDISFDFSASANYADGDFRVYIVSKTVGTVIELVQRDLFASNNGTYTGRFQALPNDTEYRLVLHCAVTSTLAFDVKIDNVQVGPSAPRVTGPVVTDWVSYTPTVSGLGTGGATTLDGRFRRVGDSAEVQVDFFKDGAAGTGSANVIVSLPSGMSPDLNKITATTIGSAWHTLSAVTTALIPAASPSINGIYFLAQNNGTLINGSQVGANQRIRFSIMLPILGWSSNLVLSEDAGGREIVFTASKPSAQSLTASVTNISFVSNYDSAGIFNGTDTITIPEKGNYRATLSIVHETSAAAFVAYINGVESPTVASVDGANMRGMGSIVFPNLKKGDTVVFRSRVSGNVPGSTFHSLSFEKIASPQTIASGETVAVRAVNNASTPLTTSFATIPYPTKIYDTHNAFNASTGVFTAPVKGIYEVKVNGRVDLTLSTSQFYAVEIRKGADRIAITVVNGNGATGPSYTALSIVEIDMNAGQTLDVRQVCSVGVNLSGGSVNSISIRKVAE
jgi:hypothetical protein